jgi:hypothetical protein
MAWRKVPVDAGSSPFASSAAPKQQNSNCPVEGFI